MDLGMTFKMHYRHNFEGFLAFPLREVILRRSDWFTNRKTWDNIDFEICVVVLWSYFSLPSIFSIYFWTTEYFSLGFMRYPTLIVLIRARIDMQATYCTYYCCWFIELVVQLGS